MTFWLKRFAQKRQWLPVLFGIFMILQLMVLLRELPEASASLIVFLLLLWVVMGVLFAGLYALLEQSQSQLAQQLAQQRRSQALLEQQQRELQHAFDNMHAISEIGKKVTASLSPDKTLFILHQYFQQRFSYDVLAIVRYDMFRMSFDWGLRHLSERVGADYTPESLLLEELAAYTLRRKQPLLLLDFWQEGSNYIESPIDTPLRSLVIVPLVSASIKLGCLYMASVHPSAFSEEDLAFLKSVGVYLAISMENAQVYERIEKQSEQIAEKNRRITDSINYASHIQQSILPKPDDLRRAFPDSFVLYEPREVVSGDFYWFCEVGNKQVLAAVDCTGHGVPGAFMSLIGANLLHEIVLLRGITDPDSILAELHKGVRRLLRQEETRMQDGMDLGVCTIDRQTKIMKFAGAKMPMIYIQQGRLIEIKGGKKPVGGHWSVGETASAFHRRFVNLSIPTVFYLFSDGYTDQFGGPDGRKFMRKRLRQLLLDIHQLSMAEQQRILRDTFHSWRQTKDYFYNQVDDVLLIGIRIHFL